MICCSAIWALTLCMGVKAMTPCMGERTVTPSPAARETISERGDLGSDTLTGKQGNNKFILTSGKGCDIITPFQDGTDFLALAGGLTFEQLSVSAGAGETLISIAGTGELLASLVGVSPNLIGVADFIAM